MQKSTTDMLLGMCVALSSSVALASPFDTTLTVREISQHSYAGSVNQVPANPTVELGLMGATPIGPGRGAGSYFFTNNAVNKYNTNAPLGSVHGMCWTVSHGEGAPYVGPPLPGVGGPFLASCDLTYVLPAGTIHVSGLLNQTALELDNPQTLPVVGGTGAYSKVAGQMTLIQDPPGQPVTYKTVFKIACARDLPPGALGCTPF